MLFHAGSCDGYGNITEPWRNIEFKSTSFPGYPKNDAHLVGLWWRFTGIGGDRITNTCYGGPLGGTQYVMRVPFSYPTAESETPTTGTAYGDVGNCGVYAISVSIALCPGGFYVHKPSSHPHDNMGYAICKG